MSRILRKRKSVGNPAANNSKTESPNITEPPCKKIVIDEEVKQIEEELPVPLAKPALEVKAVTNEEADESDNKKSEKNTEAKEPENTDKEIEIVSVKSLKSADTEVNEDKPTAEPVKEPEDPYAFMSEEDRKLMQTDIVEFLKRFTPRYFVPVYRTWSIPKSAAKQGL